MTRWLTILGLLLFTPVSLGLDLQRFDDPAKQARYEHLIAELRCLVCQNQSLADSDADLAKDLRTEVFRIIDSGKSDVEAVTFLTERYGDFVLYRPPLQGNTLLLWLGPLVLLLVGLILLGYRARRRQSEPVADLNQEEMTLLDPFTHDSKG